MKFGQSNEQLTGVLAAAGAYFSWGLLPVYWKLMPSVPAQEVLAHRIVWSFVFMVFILLVSRKGRAFWVECKEIISQRNRLFGIVLASALISVNWFTYIWAVSNNHIVQSSLGYYINPLVSVLLGVVVLKEKLSLWQIISFLLAATGVLNMVIHFGAVPWVSLTLAASFGLYGLSKKMVNAGAMTGLTLETLFVVPFALMFIGSIHNVGNGAFGFDNPVITWLLVGAGAITAVPLLLFATGAKRLPLAVIGFLQYISPTLMLILGVFFYHESFTSVHLMSFVLIWVALTIFSLSRTGLFIHLESQFLKRTQLDTSDKKA